MNILITGAWNCTREEMAWFSDMGHRVVFLQREQDPLPVSCEWVEGVICNGLFLHHPVEKFTNLRFVQLTSAGLDRVPVEYLREKGIALYNARGVYSIPMAEFAVCGVLQLYKQSRFFEENRKNRTWQKHRGLLELAGKTVCILGCGSVGTECAKRFGAFGCRVIGVDPVPRQDSMYAYIYPPESLDDRLSEADILILALPLTTESRGLIDSQRLNRMKKGAVLVNIARGPVVENQALIRWLREERGAAVLDVFEEEPLPQDSPLWELENVILTPHNSFVGEGNSRRLFALIKKNLGTV